MKMNKKNYLTFALIFLIAGCTILTPDKEFFESPKIANVDSEFNLLLDNGKKVKLAYLKFPLRTDSNYDKSRKIISGYIGLPVKCERAKYQVAYLAYRIPLSNEECFEPGCWETAWYLNYQLIKSGAAIFDSPVPEPEEIPELAVLMKAQRK